MGVGSDYRLVALILFPRNVTRMMTLEQRRPFSPWFLVTCRLSGPAIHNRCARIRLAERIGTSIDRIRKQLEGGVVDRQIPNGSPARSIKNSHRKLDAFTPEPEQYLSHTTKFRHFGKHRLDRLLYALVRVHLDLAVECPQITNRQTILQFAASGLLANRLEGSLTEQVQLELAHGSLEAKQ